MRQSSLERHFDTLRLQLAPDLPEPMLEYKFCADRKWRFDFCWPSVNGGGIAVECEGGIWTRGGHIRGGGYIKDCNKYNAAAELGYRVFRYTRNHLRDDPHAVFAQLRRVLEVE